MGRPRPPFRRREHDSAEPAPTAPETPATDPNEKKPHKRFDRGGVWFVDYKGLSADLFSKHKEIEIPEGSEPVNDEHQPRSGNPLDGPQHPPPR